MNDKVISTGICCLSSSYLAPVSYYRQIAGSESVIIEKHDNYIKQTYRNRCRIATSNGIMDLSVPVQKSEAKCQMKDVRIAYSDNWQQAHWRAIESAYGSSPFFEYYRDDFEPFFEQKTEFLIDLNAALQALVLKLIDIAAPVSFTTGYKDSFSGNESDLRDFFHPKKEYQPGLKPYYQVFDRKFGFQKDLSIIDLLFNMGPEAVFILT
ncbi:MAG: WbqC family protein [Prevotellaceae bacterium]|jgi:hypothetical protein|nr:WbqC family protein [Prevotellaceae bacterium]